MEKKEFKTNMEVFKKVVDLDSGRQGIHYFVALNPYTDRSTSECYGDVDWYLELVDYITADGNTDVCPHLAEDIMNCSSEGTKEEHNGWAFYYANEDKVLTVACIDLSIVREITPQTDYSLRANLIQAIAQVGSKIGWLGTCKCPNCQCGMTALMSRMCSDFYLDLI